MIEPFHASKMRVGQYTESPAISYGLTSYGYDMTIGDDFKVFVPRIGAIIDPKHFPVEALDDVEVVNTTEGSYVEMPPHSFALCRSGEYFKIPKNVLCVCLGKSTYARCGLILNITPLEPGWRGYVTIEVTNSTPLPARIWIGEGIAQVLFFEGDDEPEQGYGTGKYQDQQEGIQIPLV